MEIFSKDHKAYRLIHHNYNLLPVLNRFGIQLGLKDKTIETVCKERNINPDFFLAIVNTFSNEEYFPQEELLSFSPLEIIEYLKRTHRYYLNYVITKLDFQLEQLVDSRTSESQGLQMVNQFYKKYKEELKEHIDYEEKKVFPYIEKMVLKNKAEEDYTITLFEKEHTNVDEKLNDLKNLIIKYLIPDYDPNLCNEFLITLFRFEQDIYDHARIEDVILLYQATAIEKKLRK
ncbi:MAG: hemerythrin domain-containing protein [Prolixibacteraceae bacterium]